MNGAQKRTVCRAINGKKVTSKSTELVLGSVQSWHRVSRRTVELDHGPGIVYELFMTVYSFNLCDFRPLILLLGLLLCLGTHESFLK